MLRSDDEEHGRVSFESPEREFRTLAFLNYHSHPNVIQARGPCFEVDNRLVCVMEFMPGGDMLDLVANHFVLGTKIGALGEFLYFFVQ